jgi:hypothetical protein
MVGCPGSRGVAGMARRGVLAGLASALLAGTLTAQGSRFRSPKDEELFWALQDELRQISQEISRLDGSVHAPGKTAEAKQSSGSEKTPRKGPVLREQKLLVLRRRFSTVSLSALALVVPKASTKALPQTGTRELGLQEENLRQLADLRGRVDFWKTGRLALGLGGLRSRYVGTIPLDHESLEAFPKHRFYLAKIRVSPKPVETMRGMAPPVSFDRLIYQLIVLHHKTGKIRVRYGFGRQDALEPILAAGQVRAPSNATAAKIQVASAVLSRASMGANVFRKIGSKGLSQAEIDQRFGLGAWSGVHVPTPHGVLETAKERILLRWKLQSDDFGLPQRLVFEWLRFDLKDGRWLGRDNKAGPEFGSRAHLESAGVRNAVTEFARDLLRQ